MPRPLALRFIGALPACFRIRFRVLLLFCVCGGGVTARAGYALLLMSVAVAVLGSVVFVQDTWFS